MTVEEATNRLVREIEKSIPHWDNMFRGNFTSKEAKARILAGKVQKYDVEVEVAFKDLIQAIMEEQDES